MVYIEECLTVGNSNRGQIEVGCRCGVWLLSCYGSSGQSSIYFLDAIRDLIKKAVETS
jgi:hypothetical protein